MNRRALALATLLVVGMSSSAFAQGTNDRFLGTRWHITGPGKAAWSPEGNVAGSYGPGRTNWSIVPAGTGMYAPQPGEPNFVDFHGGAAINADQLLPGAPLGTVQSMIDHAMNIWSTKSVSGPNTGVNILGMVNDGLGEVGSPRVTPAGNPDNGDMRFGVFSFGFVIDPLDGSPGLPGGSSGGGGNGRIGTPIDQLAHGFQPDTRGQQFIHDIYSAIGGDMHFRPNLYNAQGNIQYANGVDWYYDPGNPLHLPALPYAAGLPGSPAIGAKQVDLLTVIFHEIGHALGLGHDGNAVADPLSVMNGTYNGPLGDISNRDMASIRQLYIPAPSAVGLFALGGVLAARRRR